MESVGLRMAGAIAHRGPDDSGVWIDAQAGVCLAHRRLAIIDLSPAGHQPMLAQSGRFVLVYNGEIYNHLDIRNELAGSTCNFAWRGRSDTETLLAAFEHWGVEATLRRAEGMFALALWDREQRRLILARDRFGEKPLYYGWVGAAPNRAFVFGSELKALRAYPGFANPVSRDSLALYTLQCVVPAPYSIYDDVFKLPVGCYLALDTIGLVRQEIRIEPYWRASDVVLQGLSDPFRSDSKAIDTLDDALRSAVARQAVADVPLGAFLSGGVDSSTIAALMQAQSNRPVQTFTVGFAEAGFDEAPHARAIAQHLGTDHHELRLMPADALSVIPRLPALYDEPFADSSQIPTHLICQAARRHVTVALSGDAGDELFGGYNHYSLARMWRWLGWLPPVLRRTIGKVIRSSPMLFWNALGWTLPGDARLGERAYKLARRLQTVNSVDDLYRSLMAEWPPNSRLIRASKWLPTRLDEVGLADGVPEAEHRMMLYDTLTYLPDDILTKVDRAAMGVGLETRIPFLDARVFRLAWRLPLHMKLRQGQRKWALKQVLYRYVPPKLIERPKAGFAIPVGNWLRGPLRDWAEDLLDHSNLVQEGYLHPANVKEIWKQHLSGQYDWSQRLWSILMFQAWLRMNT